MAQNREKGGRVVFIGNIPYGVSEEQIMDIFGRCGQVVSFRLVYDKESGQPKGFGFLEFTDTDAAASAVRNLNDFELNGRTLRVDYSNDNRSVTNASSNAPTQFSVGAAVNGKVDAAALPPLPSGIDLPPGITAFDNISQTLQALPTPQLLDLVSQLKTMCTTNPTQATALLQQAPQLGYAVFQAMCLLNLVDANIVSQLIASTPAPAPPVAATPIQPPLNPFQQPQQQYAQYNAPPPTTYQPYTHTPPVQQTAYAPPPQAQPAAAPPVVDPNEQANLVRQVLALTRDQIMMMEPGARDQIIALRAQYGAPVI